MKSTDKTSYESRRYDIIQLIPRDVRRILDVGCSSGSLGEEIKKRLDAEITGIEMNEESARDAIEKLDKVIINNIEDISFGDHFSRNYFDCVIFGDVLEHLRNPWDVLKNSINYVKRDGTIIASIPNVRHYTTICALLFRAYWPYRERGIHDRNHLRFFTLKNIYEMFENANLRIVKVERNYRLIERNHFINRYSKFLACFGLKELLTFQYLIVAKSLRSHE